MELPPYAWWLKNRKSNWEIFTSDYGFLAEVHTKKSAIAIADLLNRYRINIKELHRDLEGSN